MIQLKAFVSDRLSAAAVEIFGEVEKVMAAYQAEASRAREEVQRLRRQLEVRRGEGDSDQPEADGVLVVGDKCDRAPPHGTALKREEAAGSGGSENSQTNVEPLHSDAGMQTDVEVSNIKEEREEAGSYGAALHPFAAGPVAKGDRDQTDIEFQFELVPVPSVSEGSELSEDWLEGMSAQGAALTGDGNCSNPRLALLPAANAPTKSPSDFSSCHLCGKAFRYIGSLMKHIKMHDDQTVICGVCRKSFHSIDALVYHLGCAHRDTHFCHICGKTFSKLCFLTIHSKTHQGANPLMCPECGKAFCHMEHLAMHIKSHSEERPCQCDVCGKVFAHRMNLAIHRKIHAG